MPQDFHSPGANDVVNLLCILLVAVINCCSHSTIIVATDMITKDMRDTLKSEVEGLLQEEEIC